MTAKELIDTFFARHGFMLREYRLFARLLLHSIADRSHELRLLDGQALNDCTDFSASLRELAEAAVLADSTEVPRATGCRTTAKVTERPAQPRWRDRTCPDCHHEHEGKTECSKYLGEEKFCHCESKVTA